MLNEKTKISVSLEINQLNVILTGLVKLPYEQSAEVIESIRNQANTEIQKLEAEASSAKEETKD